jgi:hypothetical protein
MYLRQDSNEKEEKLRVLMFVIQEKRKRKGSGREEEEEIKRGEGEEEGEGEGEQGEKGFWRSSESLVLQQENELDFHWNTKREFEHSNCTSVKAKKKKGLRNE